MTHPGSGAASSSPSSGSGPVWRNRNVLVLSGVSFLQDVASEMLYPVLLTMVLGAPPVVVGAVEGIAKGVLRRGEADRRAAC